MTFPTGEPNMIDFVLVPNPAPRLHPHGERGMG